MSNHFSLPPDAWARMEMLFGRRDDREPGGQLSLDIHPSNRGAQRAARLEGRCPAVSLCVETDEMQPQPPCRTYPRLVYTGRCGLTKGG